MRISVIATAAVAIAFGALTPQPALSWGDEGHEIVALVAQAVLEPDVRSKVTGMLATDTDSLTPHDIASEASGVPAGWAAILIDTANVSTTLSIANNYLHDGVCGDGIDIRGMNTGDIGVQVNYNFITRLVQCGSVSAIQGISTQVTGTSRLRAMLFGNTQADNGSPGANMRRARGVSAPFSHPSRACPRRRDGRETAAELAVV